MKKIILLGIASVTLLVSLGGCFYHEHDRGEGRDRYRNERQYDHNRGDRDRDERRHEHDRDERHDD